MVPSVDKVEGTTVTGWLVETDQGVDSAVETNVETDSVDVLTGELFSVDKSVINWVGEVVSRLVIGVDGVEASELTVEVVTGIKVDSRLGRPVVNMVALVVNDSVVTSSNVVEDKESIVEEGTV